MLDLLDRLARVRREDLVQPLAREMLLTRERLNKILAGHTGQPIEKIQQDTERDNFMGVEAAIEYGLVDKALEKRL